MPDFPPVRTRSLIDAIPRDDEYNVAYRSQPVADSLIARAFGAGSSNAAPSRPARSLIDAFLVDEANRATSPAVTSGFRDTAGRSLAAMAGAPVDLTAMAMEPLGYKHPAPFAGSEWIGQKLVGVGAISPERRPAAEFLANLATPAAMPKSLAMMAAMSPEGKARLLADLTAGKGSGTYRLGDVTEGQAKALQRLGLPPTETRDVMMTDGVFGHLQDGRVLKDGFSPEDVTRFTEQAMSKSSQAELNTAKAYQNPALVNRRLTDAQTGHRYDAQMPLKVEEGALTPATVFPRGLQGRNKKPPNE